MTYIEEDLRRYREQISIVQYPDPILSEKSLPVDVFNMSLNLIRLIETMVRLVNSTEKVAIGLAAVQLGLPYRVIAVKFGLDCLVLINPEIVYRSGDTYPSVENCLSINHGIDNFTVNRDKRVKVRALNLKGKTVKYKARDLFGRCLQHEIDHLEGKLINNQGENH